MGVSCGVMVKLQDCSLEVNKFELQSHYYVHFPTNTTGKDIEPYYSSIYGLNSITDVLQQKLIWH